MDLKATYEQLKSYITYRLYKYQYVTKIDEEHVSGFIPQPMMI